MDRLPQEVLSSIVEYLQEGTDDESESGIDEQKLAGLATVSRAWQQVVERQIFQNINLKSTELADFQKLMTGMRRQYLQVLRYSVQLPPYASSKTYQWERNEDRARNNSAFSTAIFGIFNILASWESDHIDYGAFEFWLDEAVSQSDPKGYRISRKRKTDLYDLERFTLRYHYSYLELLQPEELPTLHIVQHLTVENVGRKFAPQVGVALWSKMPNLQSIDCPLPASKPLFPRFSRTYQDYMVSAISMVPFPENTREISLVAQKGTFLNHAWQPDNILPTHANHDPLGEAIREGTGRLKHLRHLEVSGRLDSALLSPIPEALGHSNEPFWQNLSFLHINFDEVSPSGHWYFRAKNDFIPTFDDEDVSFSERSDTAMPPGYAPITEENDEGSVSSSPFDHQKDSGKGPPVLFRWIPDEPLLVPLINSFAQACQQIPHLENARLETHISDLVVVGKHKLAARIPWGVYYATSGYESGWQDNFEITDDVPEEDVSGPRLTVSTRDWFPDPKLLQQLRKIGNHGDGLIEINLNLWEAVKKQGESFLKHIISRGGPNESPP